jgi:DNA-binding CsgD family transcriptional regulator
VFLVGLASLNVLTELADTTPILVVADDVQWLDAPTSDVLTFVARRLGSDAVRFLAAIREGHSSPLLRGGLPELPLGPLDDDAARDLLDRHAPHLPGSVLERILAEAVGNPLALVELPNALPAEQLRGDATLPPVLPLSERLEQAFAARIALLPEETRLVLLIAATNESSAIDEVLLAGAVVVDSASAASLDPAIDARLVSAKGGALVFRHPLVRSAVYQAATNLERRAAHAALADVLADSPDRRAWHLAAAVLGTDEGVARELDSAAERARMRGAHTVAVAALERAAWLSEDSPSRGRRHLRAAQIGFELGRRDLVVRLLADVQPLSLTTLELARMAWIGQSFNDGISVDRAIGASAMLENVDTALAAGDVDLALNLLTGAALRCWWVGADEGPRLQIVSAARAIPVAGDDPRLLMSLALADPFGEGAFVLDHVRPQRTGAGLDPDKDRLRGIAAAVAGDYPLAADFFTSATEGLRRQGRLGLLAQTLPQLALNFAHFGDQRRALPMADEGHRLAVETGQPLWVARARVVQALVAALRGDEASSDALLSEAAQIVLPFGGSAVLADIHYVRALMALGSGRASHAYDQLRPIFDPTDPAHHYLKSYLAIGDFAEAAIQHGDRAEAMAAMMQVESAVALTPSPRLHLVARHARALLASDDRAEGLFRDALGRDLTAWPFDRARLLLAFGSWLRRHRRQSESRSQLRAAIEAFDALGIVSWGERAREELRASGETSRRRSVASWDELSPQELQIAQMAAGGQSNREIGQRLYISHRTVGSHLYRIYPKLGITNRAQLYRVLEAHDQVTG